MNISEMMSWGGHGRAEPVPATFTFRELSLPDGTMHEIRRSIYHSTGEGYHVFRQFLDPAAVAHIRAIWSGVVLDATHVAFPGKQFIYPGCPDYFSQDERGNRTFYNFLWNAPLDELTHQVTFYVQALRNRISGRVPFAEVFPFSEKAVSYRVVITRNAQTWVAPHRDYFDFSRRFEKNRYDPSRVQATLFLSERGTDYEGTGFTLERNDGRVVSFGSDVAAAAGDLVIWRYNNLHSVGDIRSADSQTGFMRIVYPPEDVHPAPPTQSAPVEQVRSFVSHGRAFFRRLFAR